MWSRIITRRRSSLDTAHDRKKTVRQTIRSVSTSAAGTCYIILHVASRTTVAGVRARFNELGGNASRYGAHNKISSTTICRPRRVFAHVTVRGRPSRAVFYCGSGVRTRDYREQSIAARTLTSASHVYSSLATPTHPRPTELPASQPVRASWPWRVYIAPSSAWNEAKTAVHVMTANPTGPLL